MKTSLRITSFRIYGFIIVLGCMVLSPVEAVWALDASTDQLSVPSVIQENEATPQTDTGGSNQQFPVNSSKADPESTLFSSYKSNYVLPYTQVQEEIEGREHTEIKFQISIKQPLLKFYQFQLIAGYTQKSFWQAYAKSESSPFRETNYNPELMLKSPGFDFWQGSYFWIFGYEHESNGASVPLSRSWDRMYLRVVYSRDWFEVNYKIWYRLPEPKKEDPTDAQGDDNPDIHHYYGYSELMVDLHWHDLTLGMFGRMNALEDKGAVQLDLSYPFSGTNIFWYLQYWNGYGESLIDYNRRITRIGLGVMATFAKF